jgi:hypothetical protein
VLVALGAGTSGGDSGGADYVTAHFPRERDWGHVAALAEGAVLRTTSHAPVVNDEPIGAAEQSVAGRRDASPERFRAAALLSILTGMGATFHYDGGIHATIPHGQQALCFAAWRSAWTLLPGTPLTEFRELGPSDPLVITGAVGRAWIARAGSDVWVLAVGVPSGVPASAAPAWVIRSARRWPSSALWELRSARAR